MWAENAWFMIGSATSSCDQDKRPSGFVKGKQLLQMLKNYQFQVYSFNLYHTQLEFVWF